ncbi:MAG: hypothetical protein WA618_01500, partial [Terriglobales bacterium]
MSPKQPKAFSKAPSRPAVRLARHLEKNLLAYATAAGAGLVSLALRNLETRKGAFLSICHRMS